MEFFSKLIPRLLLLVLQRLLVKHSITDRDPTSYKVNWAQTWTMHDEHWVHKRGEDSLIHTFEVNGDPPPPQCTTVFWQRDSSAAGLLCCQNT